MNNIPPLPIPTPIHQAFIPGTFLYISDIEKQRMLQNAWQAIQQLELWNFMKQPIDSYMNSSSDDVKRIYQKMEELGYYGHSGFSFAWTMRQMQYIAQHGEELYLQRIVPPLN